MNRSATLFGILLCLGLGELNAQSFPFAAVLRAGRANSADWQMGVSNPSTGQLSTQYFAYDATPPLYWNDSGSQNFRMGWDAPTNTAYVSVFNQNGVATTASLQNTGAALSANAVWTLPATGFFTSASPNGNSPSPSSILLQGLQITPGASLVSGTLPTSIGSSQNGTATQSTLSAPILLNASGSGGSWYISGTVQFSGLLTQGGQARGSQLQFFMNAVGSEAPEPETFALLGGGLMMFAIANRSRRNGNRK